MIMENPPKKAELGAPEGEYERFLYSVSHDLQEPLRMISSFLKLLEIKTQGALEDDARQYLNYSIEHAERMKRMIYALVELSRVARSDENVTSIDLNQVMEDLEAMFAHEIEKHNAVIEKAALPEVKMQGDHAVTLLKNLLQNSFDNASDRALRVTISAVELGDRTEVTYRDNGTGIKEVYLDKVFEMFKRVDPQSENIGAGLTIVREIIHKYSGEVRINSTFDEHTTVTFSLPRADL